MITPAPDPGAVGMRALGSSGHSPSTQFTELPANLPHFCGRLAGVQAGSDMCKWESFCEEKTFTIIAQFPQRGELQEDCSIYGTTMF